MNPIKCYPGTNWGFRGYSSGGYFLLIVITQARKYPNIVKSGAIHKRCNAFII